MPETSAPDRGLAALRRKDHRAAIADFRRHLAEHPEDATAWHNLGLALSRMEEWQPARDAYLADEVHRAIGARLVAACSGGTEGLIVFDHAL